MATKKDIADIKSSIKQINDSIKEMRESLIKENAPLRDRVEYLETQMGKADQYSRRNNIIIKGIYPDTAKDDLENEVLEILGKIDVVVSSNEIEATHRIGKKRQNTIVRFISRKNVSKAIASRRKLKG